MAASASQVSDLRDTHVGEFRRLLRLERFKLGRRPLPKILLVILALITFAIPWVFYLSLGGIGGDPIGVDSRLLLDRLVFPGVLDASVENGISFGIPMLVVLTATSFGGEFAWGTIRLLLARGAGRGGLVVSKLVVVSLWWGVMLGAAVVSALVAGTLISAVDGAPGPGSVAAMDWMAMGGRFMVAWLASSVYAVFTALFVVQFRSTAFGLGLGLVAFFGEGIIGSAAMGIDVPVFELLMRVGINYNLRSLLGTLDGSENPVPVAAVVLFVLALAGIQATVRHLRRHDVVVAGVG